MKNFQQNLLVVFALALCLLCAGQWYRETGQRAQIENLNLLLSQKLAIIQDCTNRIQLMDARISQMDGSITGLKTTIKTNDQLILVQKRELNRLETEGQSLTNQITGYKRAVDAYEAKLKEVAAGVEKQNQALQELAAQRDEFVAKLNDSVKERNEVVAKYNELVARFEKLQGAAKPPDK